MRTRSQLGDALRCLATLKPRDAETTRTILAFLGIRQTRRGGESAQLGSPEDMAPSEPSFSRSAPIPTGRRSRRRGPHRKRRRTAQIELTPTTPPLERHSLPQQDDIEPIERVGAGPGASSPRLVPRSLFAPGWYRSALLALTVRRQESRSIDVESVVRALAARRAIHQLPYQSAFRIARKVVLLLDTGLDSSPYRQDAARMLLGLRSLFDESSVLPLYFRGDPRSGVRIDGRGSLVPCPLARAEDAVIVLTWIDDSGSAREAQSSSTWQRIARRLGRRGAIPILVVPRPIQRLTSIARRDLAVVSWDRSTTPSDIDAVVRGAR